MSEGATILNDIWGLTRSPAIADLAASADCALVVMHNQDGTDYADDLMAEIKRFLAAAVEHAVDAGRAQGAGHRRPRDRLRQDG